MRNASAVTATLFAAAFAIVAVVVDPLWIVAALAALGVTFSLQAWA